MTPVEAGVLELGRWTIGQEPVDAYLAATGDDQAIYRDLGAAPPLALAAWALAALLDKLQLPPGAIHGSQEMQCHRIARIGERIRCSAEIGRPAQRGDFQFVNATFAIRGDQGDPIVSGKTTVILPAAR